MKSDAYICVFVVGLLLVTSAFATDTSQHEKKRETGNEVKDANKEEEALEPNQYYGGRWCKYGCCGHRWGHFGCSRCCRPAVVADLGDAEPNQVAAEEAEGGYGYGYGGNGGYSYGWGRNGGYGRGGGNWGRGRGCRYGCCGHNRWGGCNYCCHNAQEATAYAEENEAQQP